MIKLERGECPKEFTAEVCEELTKLYLENRDKDVWNSPKIKKPLKDALLEMSHHKCAYCECILNIEAKDVTIDHFLPKSTNPIRVVDWENLLPSCLRCNREKGDYEGKIVNPCKDKPQDYIALDSKSRYRLRGIDATGIGKNTIVSIKLNDIQRVMVPRMTEWEDIHRRLAEILEDLEEEGYRPKYKNRAEILMNECMPGSSYAAVKATNMLDDDCYKGIKNFLNAEGKWTQKLEMFEEEMKRISLQLV